MFSYTDGAIVTSSPTGRHLSTVIRRPAGMPDNGWTQHAEQVCKVLNELDSKAKANSLSLHMQTVGRVYRHVPNGRSVGFAELIDLGYLASSHSHTRTEAQPRNSGETCALLEQRITELEKQLDDATTKLAAAQMLLEKPIEVTADLARLLQKGKPGDRFIANRTFKRVE